MCRGHASRKDCLVVAESLVRQYPFLKDPVSSTYNTRISESVIEITPLFSVFMAKLHIYQVPESQSYSAE